MPDSVLDIKCVFRLSQGIKSGGIIKLEKMQFNPQDSFRVFPA